MHRIIILNEMKLLHGWKSVVIVLDDKRSTDSKRHNTIAPYMMEESECIILWCSKLAKC